MFCFVHMFLCGHPRQPYNWAWEFSWVLVLVYMNTCMSISWYHWYVCARVHVQYVHYTHLYKWMATCRTFYLSTTFIWPTRTCPHVQLYPGSWVGCCIYFCLLVVRFQICDGSGRATVSRLSAEEGCWSALKIFSFSLLPTRTYLPPFCIEEREALLLEFLSLCISPEVHY